MGSVRTLIDTGPLVAILNKSDPSHEACSAAFTQAPAPLLTCWPVLTETAYLLGDWSSPTARLFSLLRTRALETLPLRLSDVDPVERILAKYADQGFQLADACLMHLAEREGIHQVLTLDRKDFSVFRPAAGGPLVLLP